ncbi:Rv3654c family TadE-like protein [Dermabacter vaginalis]|uniref:Helicase/secretion neighborhood TadE-like protein n=1 Tax=Dermabacter vaginalis TaxID=1630135 RepID=A0A1B0ZKP0_9MICO|nr:Rv3654c family TadE-like protein [Dermabacter vaginalis]ANP28432.1 helicase/secretion neighborhood TadE-like protein [Dermabacter vaginalis]MCG7443627.1 hypothetical protein [Dermabacter vaginalis]
MRARLSEERGNATVTALGAIAITSAILTVLVTLGIVHQGRSLAASAAELSALSAADALAGGGAAGEACAVALEVAEKHGTILESCETQGFEARIAVAVRVHIPLLGAQSLTELARAGPAPAEP